ncbi:Bacteroides conjugative transposon TraM protein [Dyadobacter koreensis]|uniref:Bacteroides conjugative transposon TraM protein n=1 Tax=Dyadobacter koreensis TaxID=408657 RepID=A0A1H7AVA4_9BACT|nr:conjugative transposon protein TraM [Dyadobacter koreensis]SEJ69519.1 Bacteroides conjugative transposon TraM protein [Dyadobacter koreensis]
MEAKLHSASFLQNRKFYTYLPVLILPFLTLAYWAIGIKMIHKSKVTQTQPQGLNTSLPDARLKDETAFNKLTYYKQAMDDSAKIREQLKKDPYRSAELTQPDKSAGELSMQGLGAPPSGLKKEKPVSYKGKTYAGAQQARIISKLKTLDSVLAKSSEPQFSQPATGSELTQKAAVSAADENLQKLESLMANLDSQQNIDPQDPELQELNSMLEKILDIQHPERVASRIQAQNAAAQTLSYPVTSSSSQTQIENFSAGASDSASTPVSRVSFQTNGFFSLDEPVSPSVDNTIKAVVHEEQTLVTGSTIKLRLTADIHVAGTLIPKDNLIFGTVSVNGERLLIDITSIRLNNSLFPVKLSVYDLDGQAGIYIPGSISRNVAKQSVSQDIQGLSLGSVDPSIGAQAASAGIQAAKTLLGKKARLVQVSVKAGYQILLKDGNMKSI